MKISRRNFLGALSVSLATGIPAARGANTTGLISSVLVDKSAGFARGDALSRCTWNSFYSYLNTDFEFSTANRGRVAEVSRLTLSAMTSDTPVGVKSSRTGPACFTLTFKGRADANDPRLTQNTYSVEHFALGRFDLFISDAALVNDEYFYTAVINRLTE